MIQANDALNNLAQVNISLYRTGPSSDLDHSIWMVHNERSVLQKLSKQVRLFAFCSVLPLFFFFFSPTIWGVEVGGDSVLYCHCFFFFSPTIYVCVWGGGGGRGGNYIRLVFNHG